MVLNTPLVSLDQLSWLCSLPSPLVSGQHWKEALMLWSTSQLKPEHWGVSNTFLATNAKHSTVKAAMGKVNSISARPNTTLNWVTAAAGKSLLMFDSEEK